MTLDASLRPLALKLIKKFGKSVTLTVPSAGTYDIATSSVTSTSTSVTVKGLVEEFADNVRNSYGERFGKDSVISHAEKKITIAAQGLTVTPGVGSTITVDGIVYTAVLCAAVYSGELPCIYELSVRRG